MRTPLTIGALTAVIDFNSINTGKWSDDGNKCADAGI